MTLLSAPEAPPLHPARRFALFALGFRPLYLLAVLGSAVLWSAAFGLYAVRYRPMLCRPRLDGRPG